MPSTSPRRWSLRGTLALGLTLVIGTGLALVLLVLDARIHHAVVAQMDKSLDIHAQGVAESIRDGYVATHAASLYKPPGHTDFFTLYGPNRAVVLTSPNSVGHALPPPGDDRQPGEHYDVLTPDRHDARAVAVPLQIDGQDHLLVVATERAEWDATDRQIHRTLLATIAIATAVVVVLALLIVRLTFATLVKHGAAVARLDADSPPQPLQGLPRELAPFADAVNLGVGRLYNAVERERRFSRDIAHELRTPLAEIRTTAEVALRNGSPSVLSRALMTAVGATTRMQRSVDTLLSLSRYESGQESPALDPLDLVAVANAQIAALQHSSGSRNITVVLAAPPAAWIHSDIGILERILSNLLQNAIEYAPMATQVDVAIRSRANRYKVTIENDAPGLQAEDIDRFGARFWRKHFEGGTEQHAGLGLALSMALAKTLQADLDFALVGSRLRARLGDFDAL